MKFTDKFEKCPGIYIFTNLINKKRYVGETANVRARMAQHCSQSNGRCVKSDQTIHKAIKKYGIENFDIYVEYLPNFNKKSLLSLEEELIKKFNSLAPNGYNICQVGNDNSGRKLSQEHKEKIAQAGIGRTHSPESRQKLSLAHKGKTVSKETGEKISQAKRGKPGKKLSEHSKAKLREANLGKKCSQETKEKLSQANKGKTLPLETRQKMAEAQKRRRERESLSSISPPPI